MRDITKMNILELITPHLIDRLGQTYIQNKEYQKSVKEADLILEKLEEFLNKEQSELLEEYVTANNATIAIMERLIYRQGMHDMLDLLTSIMKGGEINI